MNQVYEAQKENVTKYEIAGEDLRDTGLIKYDGEESQNKTKQKELKYDELDMQEYLKTNTIRFKTKITLLKLQLMMTKVGYNYGKKEQCPVSVCLSGMPDQQQHLLTCE